MAVKITYFVHGTTTDNETGAATGWHHGELSQLGIEQSIRLREQIGDVRFDAVFTSDLKRAIDSARLTWGQDPMSIDSKDPCMIIDQRLRECNYGTLSGTAEADRQKEQHIEEPFPDGESYKDVERRMAFLLVDLRKSFDGKHIAIVAHQAPQLALEVLTNGKTWEQAFTGDWRKRKAWQPGWIYIV
jgi:alpha-ribazole phosphatase/probable phosphoglycerate mutase